MLNDYQATPSHVLQQYQLYNQSLAVHVLRFKAIKAYATCI